MTACCTLRKWLSCLLFTIGAFGARSYGLAPARPALCLSPQGQMPQLSLEPMLGRYPPHRASPSSPSPRIANLDSVITDKNAQQVRTPFHADGEVHILRSAWSPQDCQNAVQAAAQHDKWSTGRHHLFPTTDIPALDLPDGMGRKALDLATEVILPHMALAFGSPLSSLYFKDMFLAKYEPNGQPGLGKHTDGSALSFNMLLSEDFKGGGTWIEPVGVVKPRIGDVLMHRGSLLHEGCKVTEGCRHVLVGFVQSDGDSASKADDDRRSELLLVTLPSNVQTLGMVLEVDEGDAISCAMVTNVADNGAAARAGVQENDCLRGIYGDDDVLLVFDGKPFDDVMTLIAERKTLSSQILKFVLERWCS